MNKKTFTNKKKKAFSLIELSIVLIIIGLLVAGVTGGASLITSSTVRAVISEVRGYRLAVNSFYDKYQALPGDYNTAIISSGIGNNDAKISYAVGVTATTAYSESMIAWNQLSGSGIITSGITTDTTSSAVNSTGGAIPQMSPNGSVSTGTTFIPASKYKGAGYAFDNNGNNNILVLTGTVAAKSTGFNSAGALTQITALSIITGDDAISIDKKMDDGSGSSGSVKSGVSSSGATYPTNNASVSLSFNVDVGSS